MKKIKMCISSKIDKDQTHVLRNAKYLLLKESRDFLHQIFFFFKDLSSPAFHRIYLIKVTKICAGIVSMEQYGSHTIQQLTSIAHMTIWTRFLAYERAFLRRALKNHSSFVHQLLLLLHHIRPI